MVKNQELMTQMEEHAKGEIQSGQAKLNELKHALEAQKEAQRQEHIKQISGQLLSIQISRIMTWRPDLKTEIAATKEERDRLVAEKNKLELTQSQLQVDIMFIFIHHTLTCCRPILASSRTRLKLKQSNLPRSKWSPRRRKKS